MRKMSDKTLRSQKMSNKITRKEFEEWLNEIGHPDHKNWGTWLRRNDPIAFNVGFNDYRRGKK